MHDKRGGEGVWMVCAHQGTHGLLRAVKLHERHATGAPIGMHHKVDAIRADSVSSKESASHPSTV